MLGKAGVKITHDYEVVDAAAPPADAGA
jgi:hypothetical protein